VNALLGTLHRERRMRELARQGLSPYSAGFTGHLRQWRADSEGAGEGSNGDGDGDHMG
jgi:hypothetical protein